ncbi:MAG TPA: hypothetical protein VH600_18660 [Burkholderiales bacterium]|jgi:hypothetical protein
MKKVKFTMLGLALAAAGSAQAAGIGARIGTTGLGADVAWDLAPTLSARVGYSGGSVDHDVTTDITYHGKLKLQNLNTFLDFAPLGPLFRFTGGFIFNDNKFDVNTDPVNGGSISGTVKPSNSAAPYLGIGYGRVSGAGVNFYADLGVMYQGSPKASLTANCGTLSAGQCSALQAQVANEQAQLEDKLKNAKYYPVLNIGLTIGF